MNSHKPSDFKLLTSMRHRMGSRALTACAAFVAIALSGCSVSEADKTANAFMTDLKAANYADAFALATPALQQKFGGSTQAMEGQIKKFAQQPTDWSFNRVNVTDGVARVHGSATFIDGNKGAVDFEMLEQNGKWVVAAVGFAK